MFRSSNGRIRSGAKEAVLRLKVCLLSIYFSDSALPSFFCTVFLDKIMLNLLYLSSFMKKLPKKKIYFFKEFLPVVFFFIYMVSSMLLQISCSTVVHALDHITQQDNLAIDFLSKKKKQKKNSKSCSEEDVNSGELLRGEKALCFIASLLDMLLLKKDLAHRSLEVIYAYICMSVVNFGNWVHFIAQLTFNNLLLCLGSPL